MTTPQSHGRDEFSAKICVALISRRGRPKSPLIARLMAEGVSRRTAFRRLKAKREAVLAKAACEATGGITSTSTRTAFTRRPHGARAPCSLRNPLPVWFWEPACGDGAISRVLGAAGFEVFSTDLVDRGFGLGGRDFLANHTTLADHIITNPPFSPPRGLAARFVEHALTRIRPGGTVCMLLRTNWEAPQAHQHLMARCCRKYTFSRRLKMQRGGYTGKQRSPQLDVSWYVFANEHQGPTQTVILPPECGDEG